MGQVVPFIARVRDSGDWTAGERARLEDLADHLAAGGVKVDVIFGATDEGDPWCVVTDDGGDVLIHVARIDGKFVVHSAVDDLVSEGLDLHAALRDRLAATEAFAAPTSATVLPFGLSARQGQTFLALVAATAFFHETSGIGDTAQAAEPPAPPSGHDDPPPPPPEVDTDAPSHDRQLAVQGAALRDSEDHPASHLQVAPDPAPSADIHAAAPEPAPALPPAAPLDAPPHPEAHAELLAPAAAEPAPLVIHGTDGDDLLVGTARNEHILGGAGADTLQGGGGYDTLEGGAGNDRIEVTAQVVAAGGKGADTFVIQAPAQPGRPEALLGVVLDFDAHEGDRLVNAHGGAVRLTQDPPPETKEAPTAAANHTFAPATSDAHTLETATLTRVEVDLDGDGSADGYLLMGHVADAADQPIAVTGHAPPPDWPGT